MALKDLSDVRSDFFTTWEDICGKVYLKIETGVLYQLRFFGDKVQALNYHSTPLIKKNGMLTFFPLPCIGTHWLTEEPLEDCPLCDMGIPIQTSIVPQFINVAHLLTGKKPVVQATRFSQFVVDRMKTQFTEEYPDVEKFTDSAKGCMFKIRHREGGKPTERWSVTHSTVIPVRLIEGGEKVQVKIPSRLTDNSKFAGKVFTFETLDLDALVASGQPKRQELLRKIEVLRVEEAKKRADRKRKDDGDDRDRPRRSRDDDDRPRRSRDDDDRPRRSRDDDDDRPRRSRDDDDDRPRRSRDDDDDRPRRSKEPDDDFAPEEGLFEDDDSSSNGDSAKRGKKGKSSSRRAADDEIDF